MIPIISGGALLLILLFLLLIAVVTVYAPTIAIILLIREAGDRRGANWAVTHWKSSSVVITTIVVTSMILLPAYAMGEALTYELVDYPNEWFSLALTVVIANLMSITSTFLLGMLIEYLKSDPTLPTGS